MTNIDGASIGAVRRFTRFYTRQAELLNEGLLQSPFSLAEARVLYELATRPGAKASDLVRDLAIDAGYLSRILKGLESSGLVQRWPSGNDKRASDLALTPAGTAAFAPLDAASTRQAGELLQTLSHPARARLVRAMGEIESLLGGEAAEAPPWRLRPHRVGDMGWVVHRQAVLYAQEYGWDESFEGLVAEIVAAFIANFEPAGERCWIAERGDEILGSVFLVRQDAAVAKLRLLYVEPAARGLGVGRELVEECIGFARQAGYTTLTLWTNDILTSARRIYLAAGFRLVAEERHRSFGHDLVGQNWELPL